MPYKSLEQRREYNRQRRQRWRVANRERNDEIMWKYQKIPMPTRPCPEACECCGKTEPTFRRLVNDHDHVTGQFRGWLCTNCNLGIGRLGDDIESVRRALAYLERSG